MGERRAHGGFFFLLGLELKREIAGGGEMRNPAQIVLPIVGAVGGIVMPDADAFALKGWAIPTATDTAFALGLIMILGKRVPASLKIFLVTLLALNDVCAILIMAIFYSGHLSAMSFMVAGAATLGLSALNLAGVNKKACYVILGIILWASVLKSGVHATLTGVVAAFFIPLKAKERGLDAKADRARPARLRRIFRVAGVCLRKCRHLAKRHRAGADFPPRVARRHTRAVCRQAAWGIWLLLSCDKI